MIIRKLETVGLFEENQELNKIKVGIGFATLKKSVLMTKYRGSLDKLVTKCSYIGTENNCIVQFYNLKMINSPEHVYSAILFAERAFKRKINISNHKGIEYILYASLQRQIKIAIEMLGLNISENEQRIPIAISITAEKSQIIEKTIPMIEEEFEISIVETHSELFNSEKIENLTKIYQIPEFEILNALSLDSNIKKTIFNESTNEEKQRAIDLVLKERMSLLSLENVSM